MPRKLLVVDDELGFYEMLCEFLIGNGYQVVVANSGSEALTAYGQERPDVVLPDSRMSDMCGLTTLREFKLRESEATVAMFTAVHVKGLVKQAMAEEAFEYITQAL